MNNSQPLDSYKNLHRKLNDKVTPTEWMRGIIVAVHYASKTADVSLLGNNASIIKNIPLSSGVGAIANVKVGQRCRVDLFDSSNPSDSCVAYLY
jgi:hypothetical protein